MRRNVILCSVNGSLDRHGSSIKTIQSNLISYFLTLGFYLKPVVSFSHLGSIDIALVAGVLLPGGGDLSEWAYDNFGGAKCAVLGNPCDSDIERDILDFGLYTLAIRSNLPILGICRGAQFLGLLYGGKMSKVSGHVDTTHLALATDAALGSETFGASSSENYRIKCYHKYGFLLGQQMDELVVIASTGGVVEIFRDNSRFVLGIMSHPERLEGGDKNIDRLILLHFRR